MAIARDTSLTPVTTSASTTNSTSYTCTGSNLILIVFLYEEAGDTTTGVTYNSVAMTKIATKHMCYSNTTNTHTSWYLIAPATGANTLTATRTGNTSNYTMSAASYTGANQSGQPDASSDFIDGVALTCGAGVTSLSSTIITVANNSWVVGAERHDNGGTSAGTGSFTKIAQGASGDALNHAIYDTNAAITPAGSTTIGANGFTAGSHVVFQTVSIAPFVATATTTVVPTLLLMGVG